jgi:hypothetical protein
MIFGTHRVKNFSPLWAVLFLSTVSLWATKRFVESKTRLFERPAPVVTLETAQFYSRSLRKFSLGFDNALADLSWVQLLQGASHDPIDHEGVSWEYATVNSVITLDPRYYRAYRFGAAFVSIFRRDKVGAKDLLQKWTLVEPLNWQSHYSLGFHLFHEMDDAEAAAPPILLAAKLPNAPFWLSSLGIRLLSESGGAFSALQAALELYESVVDEEGKQRLALRLRSLNLHLQKALWKERLNTFQNNHRRAPASLSQLQTQTPTVSNPLGSLLEKGDLDPEIQSLLGEKFDFFLDQKTNTIEARLSKEDRALETLGVHRPKTKAEK